MMHLEAIRYQDLDEKLHQEVVSLRNSVRENCHNSALVEMDAHFRWIRSLSERDDQFHFAILVDGRYAGTVSLVDIDREGRTLEWGIRFRDDVLFIPAAIIYLLIEKVFDNDFRLLRLSVRPENRRAVSTNRSFGFERSGTRRVEGREFHEMTLDLERWHEVSAGKGLASVRRLLRRLDVDWDLCI